jgi:hypothetical protein
MECETTLQKWEGINLRRFIYEYLNSGMGENCRVKGLNLNEFEYSKVTNRREESLIKTSPIPTNRNTFAFPFIG